MVKKWAESQYKWKSNSTPGDKCSKYSTMPSPEPFSILSHLHKKANVRVAALTTLGTAAHSAHWCKYKSWPPPFEDFRSAPGHDLCGLEKVQPLTQSAFRYQKSADVLARVMKIRKFLCHIAHRGGRARSLILRMCSITVQISLKCCDTRSAALAHAATLITLLIRLTFRPLDCTGQIPLRAGSFECCVFCWHGKQTSRALGIFHSLVNQGYRTCQVELIGFKRDDI